jgi:hypothetical protein
LQALERDAVVYRHGDVVHSRWIGDVVRVISEEADPELFEESDRAFEEISHLLRPVLSVCERVAYVEGPTGYWQCQLMPDDG